MVLNNQIFGKPPFRGWFFILFSLLLILTSLNKQNLYRLQILHFINGYNSVSKFQISTIQNSNIIQFSTFKSKNTFHNSFYKVVWIFRFWLLSFIWFFLFANCSFIIDFWNKSIYSKIAEFLTMPDTKNQDYCRDKKTGQESLSLPGIIKNTLCCFKNF